MTAEISPRGELVEGTCLCGMSANLIAFAAVTPRGRFLLVRRCASCLIEAIDEALDTKYARTFSIGMTARRLGRQVRRPRKRAQTTA